MVEYRIYRLDRSGHRVGAADILSLPDDEAACRAASALAHDGEVEVRQDARLVAMVPPRLMFRKQPISTQAYLLAR